MKYHEQFYIGRIYVWHAEIDGVPLHKTNHPKNYLFCDPIQNKEHAQQLLDKFSLITIDLREDFNYRIFDQRGIAVGAMYDRFDDHRAVKPPPFPRVIREHNLFRYLCDAEKALERLRDHFRYLVDHYFRMPQNMRGEFANLLGTICLDQERMKALTTGLHEKPRRKTSLSKFLDDHPD